MWGYFCLLAFILILLVELVFYIVVAGTFEDKACERVNGICAEAVREIQVNPNGLNKSIFSFRNEGVNVFLLDEDGNVILPSGIEAIAEADFDAGFIQTVKNRLDANGKTDVFHYGYEINVAQQVSYKGQTSYVLVTYSLRIVYGTVKTLQIYLIIVGVTVLLVSFLVTYVFSQKLTRGLKNMSDTAVKLAEGD